MSAPTVKEQITELRRELYLRGRVYPRFIAQGRMRTDQAQRFNARLEVAIETLRKVHAAEETQARLL